MALGYGSEEQTDEEITQKYLGCYYLDYMNRNRADGSKATSLSRPHSAEMAMLTDGATGTAVPETSESVAQAFYLYYYGSVYTFNGAGLYDCMNENGKARLSRRTRRFLRRSPARTARISSPQSAARAQITASR